MCRRLVISKIITFGALQKLVSSLEKRSKQEFPANVSDNELVNKLTVEHEHLSVSILYKVFKKFLPLDVS